MGRLLLVRHGQASFLEADYDKLSPLGEAQARELGAYWASEGLLPDAVFVGPRLRHRRTLEMCVEGYRDAGGAGAWPAATELAGLDEHNADDLVKLHLEPLGRVHPPLASLALEVGMASERQEKWKALSRLLGAVFLLWGEGKVSAEGVEPFTDFRARVGQALLQMQASGGRKRQVVAFTSAGVIGAAVGVVLRTDNLAATELGMASYNASFTELLWSGDRQSLAHFNALPHLPPGPMHTLR